MRVIIAGSRSITGNMLLLEAIRESPFVLADISEVVCGGAPGVDLAGDMFAHDHQLPVEYFLVTPYRNFDKLENLRYDERGSFTNVHYAGDYDRNGNVATRDQAEAMCAYADALILVCDQESKDYFLMRTLARAYGVKVHEKVV